MRIPTFADPVRRKAKVDELIKAGVVIIDPDRTYIEDSVSIGSGTIVYPGAILEGTTTIGHNCVIGPNFHIKDSQVADECMLGSPNIEDSEIGYDCEVGSQTQIKRSKLGERVNAKHFSYTGDASVGGGSNIGAGTVFCNYDGVNKNRTEVGRDAFIGSGTMLVPPPGRTLRIGRNAFIAAGSIIKKDVPHARHAGKNRGTLVMAPGQEDRNVTQALQIIAKIILEHFGTNASVEELIRQIESIDPQVHKEGYVRIDKEGWHIEKPET